MGGMTRPTQGRKEDWETSLVRHPSNVTALASTVPVADERDILKKFMFSFCGLRADIDGAIISAH